MERDDLSSGWPLDRDGRRGDGAWANAWFPSWEAGDNPERPGSTPSPVRRRAAGESAAIDLDLVRAARHVGASGGGDTSLDRCGGWEEQDHSEGG